MNCVIAFSFVEKAYPCVFVNLELRNVFSVSRVFAPENLSFKKVGTKV
jgi:hypothetical protein